MRSHSSASARSVESLSALPRWLPAFAALALLIVAVAPVAAQDEVDVLGEVKAMLEAEMSEPIIVQWLDGAEHRPRRPSASDLIGLKEAGASDELLARLLKLAAEPEPPAPAPAPSAAPSPAPLPAAASEASDDEVPVFFELSYVPDFDDEDEAWDFYVYVDGEPLSYVPEGSMLTSNVVRFRHYLAPGKHVLRVAQERHDQAWRGRWTHAARVSELELPFTVESGVRARADVELKFSQPKLAFGRSEGPLSFRFVQGKTVEVIQNQGGKPEDWPLVCEEIEANAGDGKEPKKALRRQLDDCVRWAELWPGLEAPSRDEIREALALFDYRPIPKDQPLD